MIQPDGAVSVCRGLVATSAGTFDVTGTVPIPEPAGGLGVLAGAGLMGLLRRRR